MSSRCVGFAHMRMELRETWTWMNVSVLCGVLCSGGDHVLVLIREAGRNCMVITWRVLLKLLY